MVNNVKELCRLCAKKDEFPKDLLDDKNKTIMKLIQDFLNIHISEVDELPTKICLNCEEKMVTFQLYVLECLKVQEVLRGMCVEAIIELPIKTEVVLEENNVLSGDVKVKEELMADEISSVIKDVDAMTVLECNENENFDGEENFEGDGNFDSEGNFKNDSDESFDELDNIAIASLKILKKEDVTSNTVLSNTANKETNKETINKKRKQRKKRNSMEDRIMKQNIKRLFKFACQVCKKLFRSYYLLETHCSYVHHIKTVVRCSCGVAIKSKSALYKHIQDHDDPNSFYCDKCPRITKSAELMEKHKMRHVPVSERKFYCSSCDKIFNSKEKLKSHVRSHVPIEERKIHQCDMCDLKFTTTSSLVAHKRIVHERIKSYVCDQCGYACGTNGELKQHRAIHSDDKPYVCGKCSKRFKTYANYKTHEDTHEETSYACFVCNKVLNSRRTLRKHLLVHDDLCRHTCSYCNKAFKRRQTLKVHLSTHTGDKPLSCKWCSETFAYASTLRSHRLRCHPDKMAPAAQTSNVKLLMVQNGSIVMSNGNQPYNYTQQTTHEQIVQGVEKSEVEAML